MLARATRLNVVRAARTYATASGLKVSCAEAVLSFFEARQFPENRAVQACS